MCLQEYKKWSKQQSQLLILHGVLKPDLIQYNDSQDQDNDDKSKNTGYHF